jgi:hypothetical protein
MSNIYRALCAELLQAVDTLLGQGESPVNPGVRLILTVHLEDLEDCADRTRAALAQPEPVALTTAEIDTLWLATWNDKTQQYDVAAFARAIIAADRARYAHPTIQPVPVSERIASIAKAVQECAFAWEPDARLIGNVCAEDIADLCGAILAPPHNATR